MKTTFTILIVLFFVQIGFSQSMVVNKNDGGKATFPLSDIKNITFEISQIPTNGLVAYYPFNGNANDESGNGWNGTINGGVTPTNDRMGNASKALLFNGTNGFINTHLKTGFTNSMTICAWIKTTNKVSWAGVVVSRGTAGEITGLVYQSNGDKMSSSYSNSTKWVPVDGKKSVSDGLWHFLTSVNDGSQNLLYIDGVLDNSIGHSLGNILISDEFYIGLDKYSTSRSFNGLIDDIRIYNRALTEQEIQALYKE